MADNIEQLQLDIIAPVPRLPPYATKQSIDVRYAVIPPYASLVFDIEVLDVKIAPPPPPAMPGQPQQMPQQ